MEKITTLLLFFLIHFLTTKCDPCDTYIVLDSPEEFVRSVANAASSPTLCDNTLEAGWYRVISNAGEQMPTECIIGGMRCGTSSSIWMNGTYPNTGVVATVQACAAHYDGDCCKYSYEIEVKNCTQYLVYNLVPVSSCYQAYCFGAEMPCPVGETSNNGFTPGCQFDPCLEENYQTLDNWQRSVNNTINANLCDNRLTPGWYRPISLVGNTMPTECTENGFRCGTTYPIWLNGSYPSTGEIADVTACVANFNGGCCTSSYAIQVKHCGSFYIYNLQATSGCYQSYCFGTEVKCPVGETSDNGGFTPGCEFDPCHSSNYEVLIGELKRSSNYTLQSDDVAIEDSRITSGWYRIDSATGNDIVNESVSMMQCGTLYPLWMDGNIPDVSDMTVDRKVCRSGISSICDQMVDIKVRNCGSYRTYHLTQLDVDKSAYCFGTLPVPDTTITTTGHPPGKPRPKEGDEHEKEDKPYIWVIVAMLAVLSTILFTILILRLRVPKSSPKRSGSIYKVQPINGEVKTEKVANTNNQWTDKEISGSLPPKSTSFLGLKDTTTNLKLFEKHNAEGFKTIRPNKL